MDTKVCSKCNEEKALDQFHSIQKYSNIKGEYTYYFPYCKECNNIKGKKRYQEHKEERDEQNRQWRKRVNKYIREYERKYSIEHPEYKLKKKEWRRNNVEKINEYTRNYADKKKHNIKEKQWTLCKQYFNYECAYCGISEEDAKQKYNKGFHKEHALNDGANDISNCIPACTGCNSSKHRNDYIDWYTPDNKVFSQERLEKIENWLTNDYELYIQ
jgi:hypothetical protein